jgi:hypothetical protein
VALQQRRQEGGVHVRRALRPDARVSVARRAACRERARSGDELRACVRGCHSQQTKTTLVSLYIGSLCGAGRAA